MKVDSQENKKALKPLKYKIAVLATISDTIKAFYEGQFECFIQAGINTTVICADDPDLRNWLPVETLFIPVDLTRVINPLKDLKVICRLLKIFYKEEFDLVQYSTPKAALLASVASFLARVPARVYLLWGLYYQGQSGIKRTILKLVERITCLLSTHILPNSYEMVDVAEQDGIVRRSKCEVILNGSACGVDLEELNPDNYKHCRETIRNELKIPQDAVVIGVFSRLTGDKGINEIVAAFRQITQQLNNVFLLVIGNQEVKDWLKPETEEVLRTHPKIRALGRQETLLPYYAAIDIFCLPSYREGFPQSPLEAQAMELPVVATDIMGNREAVVNNQTGLLVKPRSSETLIEPLQNLIFNPELRKQMGRKGKERVKQKFDRKDVFRAVVEH